jgi:hypothetical protein
MNILYVISTNFLIYFATHFVPSLHTLLDHVHLFINIYRMFTNSIHAIMAIVYRHLNTLNFVLVI